MSRLPISSTRSSHRHDQRYAGKDRHAADDRRNGNRALFPRCHLQWSDASHLASLAVADAAVRDTDKTEDDENDSDESAHFHGDTSTRMFAARQWATARRCTT